MCLCCMDFSGTETVDFAHPDTVRVNSEVIFKYNQTGITAEEDSVEVSLGLSLSDIFCV